MIKESISINKLKIYENFKKKIQSLKTAENIWIRKNFGNKIIGRLSYQS